MTSDAFGPRAELYRDSATHGNPEVLERIVEMVAPQGDELLLDVGTGPGHTAIAFAPHVKMAVASDPSIPMLQQVPLVATRKGVDNVVSVAVDAHAIPFSYGVFDLVTCRVAAHHFRDIGLAVREMARVCKVGGRVFVVDVCGSEDPWAFHFSIGLF